MKSPGGKVEISFDLGPNGAPRYSVRYRGKPVVADSPLGLTLAQTGPLASGFRVLDVKRASRDERYTLVAGKVKEARDHCEEMTVALERGGDKPVRLEIVFRAYDDGAALRYVLPKQPGLDRVEIRSEDTRFRFLADHKAWPLFLESFNTSNEREFVPTTLLAIKPESIVGPPLTIEAPRLRGRARRGQPAPLVGPALRPRRGRQRLPSPDAGDEARAAALEPERRRARHAADAVPLARADARRKPGDLIPSTLLTSLADPNEIGDTSWIKPGKVAWDWWSGPSVGPAIPNAPFKVGMNTDTYRYMIDFAAEFGLDYVLIDAGWYGDHRDGDADITKPIPELDLPGLAAYGKTKNVRVQVWLNWETVRNQMDRGVPALREVGPRGREDRLHGPQGPGDRQLLPAHAGDGGTLPPAGRLPRRLRGLGRRAHLPALPHSRGHHGPRVPEVERPHDGAPRRDDPLHAHAARADGLHAGRLPQRDPGRVRAAHGAAHRDDDARAPARAATSSSTARCRCSPTRRSPTAASPAPSS